LNDIFPDIYVINLPSAVEEMKNKK
jgi:hypothetical protein